MRSLRTTTLFFLFLLPACDPIHGIQTTAQLTKPVNFDCVETAIRSTAGSGHVQRGHFQASNSETTTTEFWSYDGYATLEIAQDGTSINYTNGLWRMGSKIPNSQINNYQPLMIAINKRIEADCGIPLSTIGKVSRF